MKTKRKKPLFRKVNTKARYVHHDFGGDYRHSRRTKRSDQVKMVKGKQRGLDYTPLFKFLLSKVGEPWDTVHSEATSRLDKQEPIFWLVSLDKENSEKVIRIGESTYYSALYVDESGILQIVDPKIGPENMEPLCSCCTHTLNGVPFTRKYKVDA